MSKRRRDSSSPPRRESAPTIPPPRPRDPRVAAIRGFYAVLDRDDEALARQLIAAGAKVLQVRLKPKPRPTALPTLGDDRDGDDRADERDSERIAASGAMPAVDDVREPTPGAGEILRVAKMARRVCDELGALLVINDRFDLALLAKADGVHLGQTDLPLDKVRAVVGDKLFIGVSTHDANQVRAALAGDPDYIAYGPVFATGTKENPDPVQGLDALERAVQAAGDTPVIAIGGITPARAPAVYATGAASICAIGAVNAAADVVAAGRALARPAG